MAFLLVTIELLTSRIDIFTSNNVIIDIKKDISSKKSILDINNSF